MKILVTHAYSKNNKGDAAILSVLLKQLHAGFPKAQIKISTSDDVSQNKSFEGYSSVPSFLYIAVFTFKNPLLQAIFAFYVVSSTLLWAFLFRLLNIDFSFFLAKSVKSLVQEFKSSDLIVPIGGGYLRAKPHFKDTVNLILQLHPILLAIILKKPVMLYSQSIGPFFGTFQRTITRLILNRTNLILTREDITVKTLKSIGVKDNLVIRTVDAGFLFRSDALLKLSDLIPADYLKNKTIIGVTVRRWLSKEKQAKFEFEIAKFINKQTINQKLIFVFIPQVSSPLHSDDDRLVADRIMKSIKNKKQVFSLDSIFTHFQIKALYNDLDLILGTRFHSVIFSLTSYVPALAIEYEYKTSGIMKDLDLSQWVIPIEKVNAKILSKKFNHLLDNSDNYKKILRGKLPSYIRKAEKNIDFIKDAFEKSL